MSITIQIHISNEEPVVAEVEALPAATDNLLIAQNPRLRDGKDLRYLAANVTTMIVPLNRVGEPSTIGTFLHAVPFTE